ncbi:hypothetical protein FB451DRAFT_1478020 [Mycena latifolia]|nr:hypothetical protein FB451DRAFT_1478020 [Mycena latifolia]
MEPPITYLHLLPAEVWLVCWTFCSIRQLRRLSIFTRLSTTLGLYQNLSSLDIQGVTIDIAFRNTLTALSRLKALTLCNCEIVALDGFLSLDNLTISDSRAKSNSGPLRIVSPTSIHTLNLKVPHTHTFDLLTGLGPGQLTRLVHLSIRSVLIVDKFFHFLTQCPRLESLSVQTFPGSPLLPVVHSSAVPLLRDITGPPQLLQRLAPNRPITCAAFVDGTARIGQGFLLRVCADIVRSSSPIHSLALPRIPLTLESLDAILSLFSDLRELSLKVVANSRSWRWPTNIRPSPSSVDYTPSCTRAPQTSHALGGYRWPAGSRARVYIRTNTSLSFLILIILPARLPPCPRDLARRDEVTSPASTELPRRTSRGQVRAFTIGDPCQLRAVDGQRSRSSGFR